MRTESSTEKNITPAIICTAPWRLAKVDPLEDYQLKVEFIDGTHGFVKMKQLIMSQNAGIFARLSDVSKFKQVYLDYGAVTWPDEIDLAPDAMYHAIKHHGVWVL